MYSSPSSIPLLGQEGQVAYGLRTGPRRCSAPTRSSTGDTLERKVSCGSEVPTTRTSLQVAYCCMSTVWMAYHSHRITQWSHEGSQSGSVTVAVLMPLGGTVGSSIPASPAQPTKFLSLIQRFGVSSRSVSYEMYRAQSPGWFACRYHSTASGAPAVIVSVGAAAALMSWHAKASSECCMPDATSGAKKVNGWLACWKLCGWAQQKEPGLRLDASQTIPSTQNASRLVGLVM
mmetsp:Transcript_17187/g.55957  ORF Transcript_17187/g.55957 Transcript_17187/m.55957 type:complete len:232 (+) Transcript_17187:130-825(+)